MKFDASVVIVSRDRRELLSNTLDSLIDQDFRGKYEIILVDDGSKKDDLESLVAQKKKKFKNLVYARQGQLGPAPGRNLGAKLAKSSIILFTDNDCLPEKNWLKNSISVFDDKNIVAFEGKIYTDQRELFTNAPENLSGGKFMTANMGYRKKVFDKLGGFDERFGFWREDSELAFRAMEKGRVIFAEKTAVYHPKRPEPAVATLRYLFLLRNEWLALFLHPQKYAKYIGFGFAINLIKSAIATALLGLAFYGILSFQVLPILAAILLRWGFDYFSARRLIPRENGARKFIIHSILAHTKDLVYPFYFVYGFFDALRAWVKK